MHFLRDGPEAVQVDVHSKSHSKAKAQRQAKPEDASGQGSVHLARISPAADHHARDIWRSVIVLKCRQGSRRALRGSCNHLDKQALALAAEHSSNYHTTILHPALSLHQATWLHHHISLSFLDYNYSSVCPLPSLLPFITALAFEGIIQEML